METTAASTTPNIFRTLNTIGKKLKSKKYSEKVQKELDAELKIISAYLDVNQREAVMFSVIFWLNCNERGRTDAADITRFLECDMMDVLAYQQEIEHLFIKKIVTKERSHIETSVELMRYYFGINPKITNLILANDPLSEMEVEEPMDVYQFVEAVSDLIEKRSCDEITTFSLFDEVIHMEIENKHLQMVVQVMKNIKDIEDRTLWYEICDDFVHTNKTGIDSTMTDIYKRVNQRLKKSRELMEKTNKLFNEGWIELDEGGFFSDATLSMTEKGRELFLAEEAALYKKNGKDKTLVTPDKIVAKTLYFDADMDRQLSFIRQSLDENMFVNLQNRLESKGLPKGMSVIFYGAPGTGKTESVYQLARQSGRSILHVDISQSKSMWFGESEKRIKEIFTRYKDMCKTEALKPILLFNEADAIFGKRKDGNASNVAQTENAMQNIILEEMEKLEGILIATTNLNQNMDAAFERRFLFKLKFEKPTPEAKQKIWLSKIDWLTETDALQLANEYSFSGGEIDNIARKATMEEVLSGNCPDISQLKLYCNAETFLSGNEVKRLGFY